MYIAVMANGHTYYLVTDGPYRIGLLLKIHVPVERPIILFVLQVNFAVTLPFNMKTAFRDVKYSRYRTTWIHFALLFLVLAFDMQATAQSETTVESVTKCETVWRRNPNCDEFNECTGNVTFKCGQSCTDTSESFVCSCNAGYTLSTDRRTCDDTDECKEKQSICGQICSNTPGSYNCSCNAGYRLAANGRSCDDIDECTERSSGCKGNCFNTKGSFTCSCQAGYRLAADGKSCDDVNECANLVVNCTVPENSICENSIGSYRCVCKTGFEHVGPLCRDINECKTFANNCTLYENTTCENTIGSYKCRPIDIGTSQATKVAIAVTICLVAVLVLIVIAVVYFVRRAKERKGKKEDPDLTRAYDNRGRCPGQGNEKGPAKKNTIVASANEHVYTNANQTSASTPSESKNTRAQVSSEILYEEFDDIRNQTPNTNAPQMEFAEILYEDFSNVPATTTKPKTKPKPKPKPNDLNTQEQCCSTNVSCSTPDNGKTDSKEATTGKTILTNVHKGIQRIFQFKKVDKDLQNGEATNDAIYQDLVKVPETNGVYEVIRKPPPKAKKISVQ